ncbi:hypothetical protein CGZ94_12195 [Enemella evansiae]|uniref:Biliverdin-producing heme oxygenase n=1 Tax=Enemella evansiae TaxID=2016499 RepID=A0A255G9U5_9ACTN|nr:biliverdin-producing heme oxygenase [Enemella evansiae]OYO12669.1 hypothetical protein CGZ94_12195 [Enemella evansiae]
MSQSPTDLETVPLSTALREHTADAHARAEESPFMADLLAGRLGTEALVALLAQSLPIYAALEDACGVHAGDPVLAPLLDPRLERTPALRADLAAQAAAGCRFDTVLPAAEAYAAELATLGPAGLLAHHYVRYLGDLSGGQIIARLTQRHYGTDPAVLTFYAFDIEKPKTYKDRYRTTLDTLPLTAAQRAETLAAAARGFELNRWLFDELHQRFHP